MKIGRGAVPRIFTMADLDALRDWYGRMGAPMPSDADIDRLFDAMWSKFRDSKDPIVRRYVQHRNLTGDNRNTEPWMALGEQHYAIFTTLASAVPGSKVYLAQGSGDVKGVTASRAQAVVLATRLMMAAPYLWMNEVDLLVRASPLPKHVVGRNLLPHPAVFFSQESASKVATATGQVAAASNWMLLCDDAAQGFVILMDMSYEGSGPFVERTVLVMGGSRYGGSFPEDYQQTPIQHAMVQMVLQRLAFIRSPYTISESTRLPRPMRRELQRTGQKDTDPLVYVVKLRRALERKPAPEESHEVDWRGHWWVSGHYRAQWHPSTESHDVIWIAPYVKGPLDKPLLEKVYAVIR